MKVSELSDDALNRLIHEKVMGECWHVPRSAPGRWGYDMVARCSQCGAAFDVHSTKDGWVADTPDYCTDLNAVAKAEAKVIDAGTLYFTCLRGVVGDNDAPVQWVTATARQRAEAVAIAAGLTAARTLETKGR